MQVVKVFYLDYNYNEDVKIEPNYKIKRLKEIYQIIK